MSTILRTFRDIIPVIYTFIATHKLNSGVIIDRSDLVCIKCLTYDLGCIIGSDAVAEVCRQFGLSRESFYQIQQAFQELGFSSFLPRKRGRKGPVKLKGEVLEFVLAQKKENPAIDPGHLAALIQERYGIAIHRTTVLRGLKKKLRSPRKELARSIRRARRSRAGDL